MLLPESNLTHSRLHVNESQRERRKNEEMSVYVGKDVSVTLQIPMIECVGLGNGSNRVFCVSKTPISDRDLDGVPNEPEHVIVYVNGAVVSVESVNDATGCMTLVSAPANGAVVVVDYRYDLSPFIAQELALEPKQEIDGLDGLGSDLVQVWACLLKEFSGSMKEPLKNDLSQLQRPMNQMLNAYYFDHFDNADNWEVIVGDWAIENNKYKATSTTYAPKTLLKNYSVGDFRVTVKEDCVSARGLGVLGRWKDSSNFLVCRPDWNDQKLRIRQVVGGTPYLVAEKDYTLTRGIYYDLKVEVTGLTALFYVNGVLELAATISSQLSGVGRVGLGCEDNTGWYANVLYDDFVLESPISFGTEGGLIATYNKAGSVVKLGFDKVVFDKSVQSTKNGVAFLTTPFKAKSGKMMA